jgi:hypothetical protein
MAHFAIVNKDTKEVIRVDVVDNSKLLDQNNVEQEANGVIHLQNVYSNIPNFNLSDFDFIQTSYNGNFRKNYASIGDIYDAGKDAFIKPKPTSPMIVKGEDSSFITLEGEWVLNEDTCKWEFIESKK